MSDNQSPSASLLNSIIGEGTRFNGEFELNGLLRIDGDFTGTIRTNGQIIVGLNGRAACNIYADSVVIGGMVRGNVFTTDKVIILSTGMMIGNVRTPRLIVEEGVVFNGNCRVTAQRRDAAQTTPTVETANLRTSQGVSSPGLSPMAERRPAERRPADRRVDGRVPHGSPPTAPLGRAPLNPPRDDAPGSEEKDRPAKQLQKVTDDESSTNGDRHDSVTSRN